MNTPRNHFPPVESSISPGNASMDERVATNLHSPQHQLLKRQRGRPVGSKAKVQQPYAKLTKNHFAYVRAVVNGLPIKNAWQIYMSNPDTDDPSQHEMAVAYRMTAKTILELAQTHHDVSAGTEKPPLQNDAGGVFSREPRPPHQNDEKSLKTPFRPSDEGSKGKPEKFTPKSIRDLITSLSELPQQAIRTDELACLPMSAGEIQDYEEFESSFSEANPALAPSQSELKDAYRRYLEKLGKEARAAKLLADAPRERKLSAINTVEGLLALGPRPESPCGLWLNAEISSLLRDNAGIRTLGDLCGLITNSGATWRRKVKGIGSALSRELESWLDQQKHLVALLPRSGLKRTAAPRKESQTLDDVDTSVKQFGLVPLQLLSPPLALDGRYGRFRSPHQNTLGADSDLQAIFAWLKLTESDVTKRAYEKESTRFYLWCLLVKGKALSDLDATDCSDFRAFLSDIPPDWTMNAPYPRGHIAWRPFNGQLSKRSQAYALKVVGILFNALHQSAYLQANAMRDVCKTANAQEDDIDTTRSLNEQARAHVLNVLAQLPDSALNRRKRAIFELATRTGLRRTEISAATWGDLTPASVGGRSSSDFELKVVGKGGRVRKVPVMGDLVQLLRSHEADAVELSAITPLSHPNERPLISALEKPVHLIANRSSQSGQHQANGIRNPIDTGTSLAASNGALSPHGLYQTIRVLFRDVAKSSVVPPEERAQFLKASIHWFRHTFAHAVLEGTQGDLSVTQDLLGHASLQTTGKYLKQDGSARMKAARLASAVLTQS